MRQRKAVTSFWCEADGVFYWRVHWWAASGYSTATFASETEACVAELPRNRGQRS